MHQTPPQYRRTRPKGPSVPEGSIAFELSTLLYFIATDRWEELAPEAVPAGARLIVGWDLEHLDDSSESSMETP